MRCLYLDAEGQSCWVGSVEQSLLKNGQIDLLDRMTQMRSTKNVFLSYFGHNNHSHVTRNR